MKSWDFHLTSKLSCGHHHTLSVWDERHIKTMCFHFYTVTWGSLQNPQHKPQAPAIKHRVTGPLNASLQTRLSTSRAKLLPYPISHQTLIDLMWESIITPVSFAASLCSFFSLIDCHGSTVFGAPSSLLQPWVILCFSPLHPCQKTFS